MVAVEFFTPEEAEVGPIVRGTPSSWAQLLSFIGLWHPLLSTALVQPSPSVDFVQLPSEVPASLASDARGPPRSTTLSSTRSAPTATSPAHTSCSAAWRVRAWPPTAPLSAPSSTPGAPLGSSGEAQAFLDDMAERSFRPPVRSRDLLVDGLIRDGCLEEAKAFALRMTKEGLLPDVATFNSLAEALCSAGDVEFAVSLLADASSHGLCPDISTYKVMIPAVAKAGRIDKAFRLFYAALEDGHRPFPSLYAAIIKVLRKAGRFADAFVFFGDMKSKGHPPNHPMYLPSEVPADASTGPPLPLPLRRLTVVLDLDETLVCAYESSSLPAALRAEAIEAGLHCFDMECISAEKARAGNEQLAWLKREVRQDSNTCLPCEATTGMVGGKAKLV
ncbi:hypothetical protein E2562_028015 [Oryza meyeriana var. granulata]|uniref:FCP1 homology domain-containing protein n=1 Tax=Oryza meyeriana var. granulata TaxID=110450 RepID=A0A6G1CU37_9ORYZ|nr:hypothetical protein E2562_028015 [Oryza meyeriana var. granulata]